MSLAATTSSNETRPPALVGCKELAHTASTTGDSSLRKQVNTHTHWLYRLLPCIYRFRGISSLRGIVVPFLSSDHPVLRTRKTSYIAARNHPCSNTTGVNMCILCFSHTPQQRDARRRARIASVFSRTPCQRVSSRYPRALAFDWTSSLISFRHDAPWTGCDVVVALNKKEMAADAGRLTESVVVVPGDTITRESGYLRCVTSRVASTLGSANPLQQDVACWRCIVLCGCLPTWVLLPFPLSAEDMGRL